MRSPLTFDLVTYLEELQEFSLNKYLEYNLPFTNNQTAIESCDIKVNREDFCSYLEWVLQYLLDNKVKLVKQTVTSVQGNTVNLANGKSIKGDAVVFCIGYKGKDNIPSWIKNTSLKDRVIKLNNILQKPKDYFNKKWLVLGSGQGAAEQVNYFSSKLTGEVTWVIKKEPKLNQYPAPNYKEWGTKSALGSYYKSLTNYKDRLNYLNKVKQWQPSITSYIASKLKNTNFKKLIVKDYSEVINVEVDYISLVAGLVPSLNSLPLEVNTNAYIANFPDITNNFKLNYADANWYVSGILATAYDGPRQHSLISAGITAKEIIKDIEHDNI
jgi:lysine/ornithine N-monooxygenase